MPTSPLEFGSFDAHSTSAAPSLPCCGSTIPKDPSDRPVPRISVTTLIYPRRTSRTWI